MSKEVVKCEEDEILKTINKFWLDNKDEVELGIDGIIRKTYLGKILTLIDSSIPDQQQNKAMKDIIKGIFDDMGNKIPNQIYHHLEFILEQLKSSREFLNN